MIHVHPGNTLIVESSIAKRYPLLCELQQLQVSQVLINLCDFFTLQADGVTTQNYGATTVACNGQVGSLEGGGSAIGVGGWGGALRLRKQFVQKFDGIDYDYV